jgi:hypothetical protein
VFVHEARACRLDYVVACDVAWRTVTTQVNGWVGDDAIAVAITVDPSGRWWMNEREVPEVIGAVDVDLNFSPSTNLLPIRRLRLDVGQSAPVRAAWLRSRASRSSRSSRRTLASARPRIATRARSGFAADLEVDDVGFVTRYGDVWATEARG